MIGPHGTVRVYLAAGHTDMRKGFDGLSALVQSHLRQNPASGPFMPSGADAATG